MDIRQLKVSDIPLVQLANLTNLPENYMLKYYLYHALSWPQLSYVAVDTSRSTPKVVGYVLAKIDEDNNTSGHITSLSVMRTHRRLGLAEKLMRQSSRAMREYYGARQCSLHVRCSNEAAIGLYSGRLGFEREKVEAKYYADAEDAWCMKLDLVRAAEKESEETTVGGAEDVGEVGDEGRTKLKSKTVKVGRSLGVGDLVEKNDIKKETQTTS